MAYSSADCPSCAEWNAPQRPFHIHDDSWYVGTHGLSAILVTSPEGHVLIDAGLPESAPLIMANIRALGFRVEDVKLIVNSHAHYDHAGGIAEIQRASGAAVVAHPWSAAVMRRGTTLPEDPQYAIALAYPAVAEIRELADGDTVRVGPIALTAHFTGGHTPGGTSWSWRSCEGTGAEERCLDLVYADSQTPVSADDFLFTSNTTYPAAIADFERGFETLERLSCDVLLTPHPGASGMLERLAAREAGRAEAFRDADGCRQYAASARRRLAERVAREKGADTTGEWSANGGDLFGARWSPLDQITRANVSRLEVAWTASTGEAALPISDHERFSLEATPLVVDGTMYVSTPLGRVIALDPATGERRWLFDPQVDQSLRFGDFTNRGVAVWLDRAAAPGATCRRTVFAPVIDARIVALDAATGARCARFGQNGEVDLRRGLRNAPEFTEEYELTSPPVVVNGIVVVGSAVADNVRIDAPSGEVRGYDARTGALRWTWHPVPQDSSDPAYASWQGPVAHRTGAANAWTMFAADPARDLVFVPTASPSPDYYGGERLGDNRYASSIVALRASTGRVVWHFQTVHHDIWDYDNAPPPTLVTLRRGGGDIPAVIQATKTGQLFVLHRETGEPVVPVEERPVPASDVSGERASPTQPFSASPQLGLARLDAADAWGLTASDRDACRATVAALRNEGIFTPPSLRGTLVAPSNVGGAHWGGVAFDPERQIAVVPVNRLAAVVQLVTRAEYDSVRARRRRGERMDGDWEYAPMHGTPYAMRRRILLGPGGLPCSPPPFGTLAAVSLETGRMLWEVPLGTVRGLAPETVVAQLPDGGGSPNLGGAIVTAGGVVFVGATIDRSLRAFDIESGRELWRGELPAGGKATPMTYRIGGRQYVTIAAGGGSLWGKSDAIVTFALPEDGVR